MYVDLPTVETEVAQGDGICTLESVKAVSSVYSPVDGTVVAVNEPVVDDPTMIATKPESEGWLFKVQLSDKAQVDELMDKGAYDATLA